MPQLAPNSLMKRYDEKYVIFFAPICKFVFYKMNNCFLDFLEFQTDSNDSIESYEAYKAKRKDSRSDSLGKEKARLRFKLIVCKSKKRLLAMSLSCFAKYVFKFKKKKDYQELF